MEIEVPHMLGAIVSDFVAIIADKLSELIESTLPFADAAQYCASAIINAVCVSRLGPGHVDIASQIDPQMYLHLIEQKKAEGFDRGPLIW